MKVIKTFLKVVIGFVVLSTLLLSCRAAEPNEQDKEFVKILESNLNKVGDELKVSDMYPDEEWDEICVYIEDNSGGNRFNRKVVNILFERIHVPMKEFDEDFGTYYIFTKKDNYKLFKILSRHPKLNGSMYHQRFYNYEHNFYSLMNSGCMPYKNSLFTIMQEKKSEARYLTLKKEIE